MIYYVPVPGNAKPSTIQKHVPHGRIQVNVSPDKQDNAGSSAGGPFHVSAYPFDGVESPPFPSKSPRMRRGMCNKGTWTHIRRRGTRDIARNEGSHRSTPYARHGCMRRKCMKHVHRISAATRLWLAGYIPSQATQIAEMERCNRNRSCRSCGAAAAASRRSEGGCDVVAVLLRRGRAADRGNHGNGKWEFGPLQPAGPVGQIDARKRNVFDLRD